MSAPVQPRPFTSREEVNQKILTLRQTFQQGRTKDIRWRKWQLKQLYWMIEDNEAQIVQALNKDLGRHEFETMAADIAGVKGDIVEHIKHLEEWVADEHPNSGFLFSTLGSTVIRKEPLGLVLIIAAWNFPILLCFQPLVAAIASGCTAIVKPSEITQNAQDLVCQLMSKYLDPSYYTAVTGGVKETGYILSQKFDHIFFTGSTPVAKHVAKAAAIHLTPTVLELGGQGPAIVTKSADIDMAAKRISYAKFVNAGQICLSVNHVFVDPEVHTTFVQRLIYWHKKFSGGKDSGNQMANIVDDRNFKRLETMLQESLGEVVLGGSGNKHLLQFDATVIDNTTLSDSLLQTELFGPLLPVIVASSQDACHSISNMPHPLAIYIFSNAEAEIDYSKLQFYLHICSRVLTQVPVLDHTLSGGVSINDVFMHASAPDTPFGGVGKSTCLSSSSSLIDLFR